MRSVGSRELKNRLGTYLRQVRAGATLIVTDRGRPIAELRPLAAAATSDEEALAGLAADGLVSPPTSGRLSPDYEPLRFEGQSLSAGIIEERRDRP